MDHLPYPPNPAPTCLTSPKALYRCTEPYRLGNFLTYPADAGWDHVIHAQKGLRDYPLRDLASQRELRDLEDFYQRWLFFGLLHAVFQDRYQEDHFTDGFGSEKVVHTVNLSRMINDWMREVATYNDERKKTTGEYLSKCLFTFRDAAWLLLYENRADFDRNIRMSIAALGEALTAAMALAFKKRIGDDGLPYNWGTLYLKKTGTGGRDTTFDQQMIKNGWCANTVHVAFSTIHTVSFAHFLTALDGPRSQHGHTSCTADCCQFITIKDGYEMSHTQFCTWKERDKHREPLRGPLKDDVAASLNGASFPVLKIQGSSEDDMRVIAIKYRENLHYVALSHVWADGLGNRDDQLLPRCQLWRLKKLLSHLSNYSAKPDSEDLLLWCDTLCVPPDNRNASGDYKELRRKAMGRMREVYANAEDVLIFDKTLDECRITNDDTLEAAVRISVSPWMTRLWTYQEVYLSKRALFKFANRIVDLQDLWNQVNDMNDKNALHHSISTHLQSQFWLLRMRHQLENNHTTIPATFINRLHHLIDALRQRQVSVPSDEALCLCTALNLDPKTIIEANKPHEIRQGTDADKQNERKEEDDNDNDKNEQKDDTSGMEAFWRLVVKEEDSIPSAVIFSDAAKIKNSPFRWAPKSLLSQNDSNLIGLFATHRGARSFVKMDQNGLMVSFPAWRVEIGRPLDGFESSKYDLEKPERQNIVWAGQEGWWHTICNGGESLDETSAHADRIIIIRSALTDSESYAMLGEITMPLVDRTRVRGLGQMIVRKFDENNQKLWSAAIDRATELRRARREPYLLRAECRRSMGDRTFHQRQKAIYRSDDVSPYRSLIPESSDMGIPTPAYDFARRVSLLFLGKYWIVKQSFGEATEWSVD